MSQEKFDTDDDALISDACGNLREMEVPSSLKTRCLAAAQDGLADAGSSRRLELGKPNSHAFRLPAAIAASLLVGLSFGWILRGETQPGLRGNRLSAKPTSSHATTARTPNVKATSVVEYQERSADEAFFTEETYLCGVGRIQSRSNYQSFGEQQ